MTQNERVKQIRKSVGLTLEKFGARLGVGKTAISKIEAGENRVSDQMLRSICREFDVNEEWLRSGAGDPFLKETDDILWATLRKKGLGDHEYAVIAQFVSLPPEDRERIISYIRLFAEAIASEDADQLLDSGSLTPEEAHRRLDEHLSLEKKPVEESEVSGFGNSKESTA